MARKKSKKSIISRVISFFKHIIIYLKGVFGGILMLLITIFLTFSLFNLGGSFGKFINEEIFYKVFGLSQVLFLIFLYVLSYILIKQNYMISPIRFFGGSILLLLTSTTFLNISFSESVGGLIGHFVYSFLFQFLGIFTYFLIIVILITSLVILFPSFFISIWNWIMENKSNKEDEMDEEEYDDEEEDIEEEEEYEDEEYDMDEEDEEEYEEEDEEENLEIKNITNSSKYIPPPLSLLENSKSIGKADNTKHSKYIIERTMANFKINVSIEDVTVGPTFTRYSLKPAEGVRLNKITGLQQNLELALAAHPIRIEAPIPGKSLVGIEVPNTTRAIVGLRSLLESFEFKKVKNPLPLAIGKDISGSSFIVSLSKMPHLLVAGTTGSGKSVLIHNLILSMIFKYGPKDLRFIFIDPKRVELTLYKGIPHMFTNPITNPKEALKALTWIVSEMERRYELLEEATARDINSYNKTIKKDQEYLPYLVVVIDELADLMQSFPREIESNIVRIAQKSRAVGIHLIISTQRPSVNIITGVVKANIPVRIGLQVASNVDSRTILDTAGAENLTGNGDLLYTAPEVQKPFRAQSAFVSEKEVKNITKFLIQKNGLAEGIININEQEKSNAIFNGPIGNEDDDELYDTAKIVVMEAKKASTSLLQRKLKVGYSRAARLIDMLEDRGIVSPQEGSKPRKILIEEETNN